MQGKETSHVGGFYRNVPQTDVLLDLIGEQSATIGCFGCGIGCEPYTIVLRYLEKTKSFPNYIIEASDISDITISRAINGSYFRDEVYFAKGMIPDSVVSEYFDIKADMYLLKRDVCNRVSFSVRDLFDPLLLKQKFNYYDITMCQNVITHYDDEAAVEILNILVSMTKINGYIFVGGHDPFREKAVRRGFENLQEVTKSIEEIHNNWHIRRSAWEGPNSVYWALEPLDKTKDKWERIYTSIYKRVS